MNTVFMGRAVALAASLGLNILCFDISAHAQLGGDSALGTPGIVQENSGSGGQGGSSQNGSAAPMSFGIDMQALMNGDTSELQRMVQDMTGGADECGGDGLAGMAQSAAAMAASSTFSGAGYPTMDVGMIIRAMLELKESMKRNELLCGTRRDHSTLTDMADRAESGWRSVIPDGVTIDSILRGSATGTVLSGLVDRFINRDRVYQGPIVGFNTEELARRRRSISGAMAAQHALLEQISVREDRMRELTAAHRSARTAAAKQDIANRYREEEIRTNLLRGQLSGINARAEMEVRNSDQRLRENEAQEIEDYRNRLMAAREARFQVQ